MFNGDPEMFSWWKSKMYSHIIGMDEELWDILEEGVGNLRLHFSGTFLGCERRTGLLPVCGRNLYNCLCSLFFSSLLYPLLIDSELTQTLNYFRL